MDYETFTVSMEGEFILNLDMKMPMSVERSFQRDRKTSIYILCSFELGNDDMVPCPVEEADVKLSM